MEIREEQFRGYECLLLRNQSIRLWLTTSLGLRIIGLSFLEGENILAELPEAKIDLPDGRIYHLRGGHRLWVAPERPESTYLPDDRPVKTIQKKKGVLQIQPVDQETGLEKAWVIKVGEAPSVVKIHHRLTNRGEKPVSLAPWAITMLKPGGTGIFPQHTGRVDQHGLHANRNLVLWPYTPVNSPFFQWEDEGIFISASMDEGALKIGFPNPDGWMAYALGGTLFVKRSVFDPRAIYFDRGASSEVYCCKDFIELETLAGYGKLMPGETVQHLETWDMYSQGTWPEQVDELYKKTQDAGS